MQKEEFTAASIKRHCYIRYNITYSKIRHEDFKESVMVKQIL